MENIEINAKLIIIVVLISAVLGTLLWVGYNIYTEATEEEEEGIENFESDFTSNTNNNIQAQINNNNNHSDDNTEFNLSDIIGDEEFEINNSNATTPKQGWVKRVFNYRGAGYRTMYYVPNDWEQSAIIDKKNGVSIKANYLKVNNVTDETTYEKYLDLFIQTKENKENSPDEVKNYSKRTININGEKFYVLVEKEYYNAVYEYFCLAKENNIYYLEMATSNEKYNEQLIESLNEIYSTFRIVK